MKKNVLILVCTLVTAFTYSQQIQVTDVTGRTITLKKPAKKVLLAKGAIL